eukprot:2491978-Rhodomonas_salina.2
MALGQCNSLPSSLLVSCQSSPFVDAEFAATSSASSPAVHANRPPPMSAHVHLIMMLGTARLRSLQAPNCRRRCHCRQRSLSSATTVPAFCSGNSAR